MFLSTLVHEFSCNVIANVFVEIHSDIIISLIYMFVQFMTQRVRNYTEKSKEMFSRKFLIVSHLNENMSNDKNTV